MKRLLYILILFSSIVLPGCEKVIDLDLDTVAPVVVIEASISDVAGIQTVRVSKTYSFSDPNKFNSVSGAVVVMTSSDGQTTNFTENKPGIYESTRMRGRVGVTYVMRVSTGGKTYTATCAMPSKVDLSGLSFRSYSFFKGDKTYVVANFLDQPFIQNQYRYVVKRNGVFLDDFVSEDRFDDGNQISNVLFTELEDLKSGEIIEVELQCIDRKVFKYFYGIEQNSGDGPPVAPANPDSNFDNGALGVFNVYTSSRKISIIQ
jgi:hypothetical protein